MQLIPHQELGVGELRICESGWDWQASANSPQRLLGVSALPVWRSPGQCCPLHGRSWSYFYVSDYLFTFLYFERPWNSNKNLHDADWNPACGRALADWTTFPSWWSGSVGGAVLGRMGYKVSYSQVYLTYKDSHVKEPGLMPLEVTGTSWGYPWQSWEQLLSHSIKYRLYKVNPG